MSRYDRRSGTCNLSNCKVTRKKLHTIEKEEWD